MATDADLQEQVDPSYLDSDQPDFESEPNTGALQSVPWVAIAFAVHVIVLVMAWFVIPRAPEQLVEQYLQSSVDQISTPPEPEMKPEEQVEFPDENIETEKQIQDKRIPTEDSDHAEDPTNDPSKDLAKNPNDVESPAESPHPNRDPSSSTTGLGGPVGGGGGEGGPGGAFHHRPGPSGGRETPNSENVDAALRWLADHQDPEGYWSARSFRADSVRENVTHTFNIDFKHVGEEGADAGWQDTCDVGLTGLAMLAFTGFGLDHRSPGYGRVLRQSTLWLRKVQDNDGCFGDRVDDHFVYNHAIAAMALAELYGISGDNVLRPICDRAVDFILTAQNPGLGWRYGVQTGFNDSSVTGWMVLTLHTCELAGLEFNREHCYADAAEWYETVTIKEDGYLKCGYDTPGSDCSRLRSVSDEYDRVPSMDAIYVMSMLFMGERDLSDSDIRELAGVCVQKDYLPQWKVEKIDYYYWYYASQALYQIGGGKWKQWEKAVVPALIDHQRGFHEKDLEAGLSSHELLDEHGSWDPIGAWGSSGGRVYATAINCLTLQTYYRHKRLHED